MIGGKARLNKPGAVINNENLCHSDAPEPNNAGEVSKINTHNYPSFQSPSASRDPLHQFVACLRPRLAAQVVPLGAATRIACCSMYCAASQRHARPTQALRRALPKTKVECAHCALRHHTGTQRVLRDCVSCV